MRKVIIGLLLLLSACGLRDFGNDDWYWDFTPPAQTLLLEESGLTPEELHELVMPYLIELMPDYHPDKDGISIRFSLNGVPGKIGYCCRNGHPEVFMDGGFNLPHQERLAWQVALVIAHELGHWRGLSHSDDPCSIMHPFLFGCEEPYWD